MQMSGVCRERVASDLYCINFRVTLRLHAAVYRVDVCTRVHARMHLVPWSVGCQLTCWLADARLPLSDELDRLFDRLI